jgi:hypothetical protein
MRVAALRRRSSEVDHLWGTLDPSPDAAARRDIDDDANSVKRQPIPATSRLARRRDAVGSESGGQRMLCAFPRSG